jgi:plasmid stabilization system protein ParE
MPRGSKAAYTGKQKRQAEHIEEGYEKRGVSRRESERRAWATVNKTTGGGKKSSSERAKKRASSRSSTNRASSSKRKTKQHSSR